MSALDELLDRLAHPDRPADPAFFVGRRTVSRGDFGTQIRGAAGALARAGLQRGETLGFFARPNVHGLAYLLGALRAGLVVALLEPRLSATSLRDHARATRPVALLTDSVVGSLAASRAGRAHAARRGLGLVAPSEHAPRTLLTGRGLVRGERLHVGGDQRTTGGGTDPAVIVFTSGTTGSPRGVVHGRDGLAAAFAAASTLLPLGREDRVLGSALHLVAPALVAGAPVVLATGGPERLARLRELTHLSLPLHRALAFARAGGTARHLVLGSAPVRNVALRELAARLPTTRLLCVYGMTEQLLVAALEGSERLAHDERDGDLVGTPLPGVTLHCSPSHDLSVGGAGQALGYLGQPPFAGLHATGDLARIDAQGRLLLLGRRKEMLIRDGENIYPPLYEPLLAERAGLEAALLVGVPERDGNERVVLFAIAADPDQAVERARAACRAIDPHARPDTIFGLTELPRTGRLGKPDRRALVELAAARLGLEIGDDPILPAGER